MVKIMESILKVDGQGRTVLPKKVRQALGIDGGTELVCRVVGNRIVLEKFSRDSIRKAFRELEELATKVRDVKIENPIPINIMEEYHEYIRKRRR